MSESSYSGEGAREKYIGAVNIFHAQSRQGPIQTQEVKEVKKGYNLKEQMRLKIGKNM